MFLAGFQEDRQVAPGEDMGARLAEALHQVFIVGIQFRGPAGEVHRGNSPARHRTDDRLDGLTFASVPGGGPGLEVAVLARLVAAPSQVDLQGADAGGLQVGKSHILELAGEGQHRSSGLQGDLGGGVVAWMPWIRVAPPRMAEAT